MNVTQRELDNRLATPSNVTTTKEQQKVKSNQNQTLSDFASRASEIVSKMKIDAQNAQNAFKDCAEYFGEDPKLTDCTTFFGYFVRFIATWKIAQDENEKRQKMQQIQAQKSQENNAKQNQVNVKSAVINELKTRNNRNLFKPAPNDIQDGTFEDIILGMKSEPYRANIENRKSFRRQRSDNLALTTNETEPL